MKRARLQKTIVREEPSDLSDPLSQSSSSINDDGGSNDSSTESLYQRQRRCQGCSPEAYLIPAAERSFYRIPRWSFENLPTMSYEGVVNECLGTGSLRGVCFIMLLGQTLFDPGMIVENCSEFKKCKEELSKAYRVMRAVLKANNLGGLSQAEIWAIPIEQMNPLQSGSRTEYIN